MMRLTTAAILAGAFAAAAMAAPQNQLVAPNFNPALKSVPYVPQSQSARADACKREADVKTPVVAAKGEPTAEAKEVTHNTVSSAGTPPTDACPQSEPKAAANMPQPIGPQH